MFFTQLTQLGENLENIWEKVLHTNEKLQDVSKSENF